MSLSGSDAALLSLLVLMFLPRVFRAVFGRQIPFDSYVSYTGLFFLCIVLSDMVYFPLGIWMLAVLCFWALREYFSLIDIRLQDRLGILGAYLSIPFMIYYIQIDWYGMFIISIPVYSFLAIPLLVTLGGKEAQGTVFSIGAIVFGLFLFVYCLGHIGYLLSYSPWMVAMLILNVAVCDLYAFVMRNRKRSMWARAPARYGVPLPLTVAISVCLSPWTGVTARHSIILGMMIPLLVVLAHHTIGYVKADLGVRKHGRLLPGEGQVIDHMGSLFFAAPLVFHYFRYFFT